MYIILQLTFDGQSRFQSLAPTDHAYISPAKVPDAAFMCFSHPLSYFIDLRFLTHNYISLAWDTLSHSA